MPCVEGVDALAPRAGDLKPEDLPSPLHLISVGIGAQSFNIVRSSHGTADIDTCYQHFNIETTYKKQKQEESAHERALCQLTSEDSSFHDFLQVVFTLQTSRTNNKRVIRTFKFAYPRLILKEGLKVKSDHIRRFLANAFL